VLGTALLLSAAGCGPSAQPQKGGRGMGAGGGGGGGGGGNRGKGVTPEERRAATMKTMTAGRAKVLTKEGGGKMRGAPVLPRGGPGGGTPQLPSDPVQRIVAEVRSAVMGDPDPATGPRRNLSQLPGVGLHRGAFVTSDSGYTFRPCDSKTLYLIRGSQEAIYLLNERLRFSSRGLRNPFYVQLEGRLMELDQLLAQGGAGGGPAGAGPGGQAQGAGGAGGGAQSPAGGRRRPTGPQFMVTKFVSMDSRFPADCPRPSGL